VDAGAGVGLAAAAAVPAALVALSFEPARGRLGVRVAAAIAGERQQPLGVGRVGWRRWPLLAGVGVRLLERPADLALRVSGAIGWLRLAGRGFDTNRSHGTASLGVAPGLRLGLRRRGWSPWLGLDVPFWLRRETAYERPGEGAVALPRWEALAAAGVAFGR
jgi:hypothetical protein